MVVPIHHNDWFSDNTSGYFSSTFPFAAPPIGHIQPIQTFIDRDLFEHVEIWAAAGTPHALFKLTPRDLERITKGAVTDLT
jgi:prolyl-tRNA editing enzyme YbaK/EbsC (Cys-tRNA(Pro) deacylase)